MWSCDLDLWPFDLIRTPVVSLMTVISAVLVLSCKQTDTEIQTHTQFHSHCGVGDSKYVVSRDPVFIDHAILRMRSANFTGRWPMHGVLLLPFTCHTINLEALNLVGRMPRWHFRSKESVVRVTWPTFYLLTLHIAFNTCTNFSFLHLYLLISISPHTHTQYSHTHWWCVVASTQIYHLFIYLKFSTDI